MKILTNKQINKIDLCTSQLHNIINNRKISNDDYGYLLANIDSIRSTCKLSYLRRMLFYNPQTWEIKPPKGEACKHVFKLGTTPDVPPFIYCMNCGEIKFVVPVPKKTEEGNADKTFSEMIESTCEDICDNFCKYRDTCDQNAECEPIRNGTKCPLDKLV